VEVDVNTANYIIEQQKIQLKIITSKLNTAFKGEEVGWIDTGKSQGLVTFNKDRWQEHVTVDIYRPQGLVTVDIDRPQGLVIVDIDRPQGLLTINMDRWQEHVTVDIYIYHRNL